MGRMTSHAMKGDHHAPDAGGGDADVAIAKITAFGACP